MFRFCIADTEHDWREGTEQYNFIEHCLASTDRKTQPWLIFLAHRVLGYSSASWYAEQGSFAEPMGRESLQKLWQKYKVDIAIYGHVHNYERTCPIYEVFLTTSNDECSVHICPLAAFLTDPNLASIYSILVTNHSESGNAFGPFLSLLATACYTSDFFLGRMTLDDQKNT